MTPQEHDSNMYSYSDYPTSPWTEAYQAAPMRHPKPTDACATHKNAFDTEALRPTHDALSAIYNRGY
jgi:hypothetical protein